MRWLPVMMALAACNTPGPGFRGLPPVRVTVGPSTFDVRRQGDLVELIRVTPEAVFTLRDLAPRAAAAVRQATGCALIPESLQGEATLMQGRIACADEVS